MTPVFTPGLTQGHYGVGKRRPYQFRQAELVMAGRRKMLDDCRCRLGRPFCAARPFYHALEYANLTLAQWRCVSGPVDDQGLQWQSKRLRCGSCALHEVLQQLSLRIAYVADCESNLLFAGRWLLSNLFAASMSGITLGAWDADQPPLSLRSVSSALDWMPASTIAAGLFTASFPARQCSCAPSNRPLVGLSLSSLGIVGLVGLGLGSMGCLVSPRTIDLSFSTAVLTGFGKDRL
ncbi:hypothetical protein HPB50_017241 [Hyalomma asiaticum]|uniref:Uncharacterized protein n=1 Tax=Hyalomma asiaticum TaxID=266040 RepID=A0ACB7TMC8_HYAAI|nr:hypothetical protein HPB50_017241 [Hyalomma asiaticum]